MGATARHTTIKICGLMTKETAETVGRLPVDHVGFVFAESRRQVSAALAGELTRTLRRAGSRALTVGVFVKADIARIAETIRVAGLTGVQLHGDEPPDFCREVKAAFPAIRLFKVFTPQTEATEQAVRQQLDPFRACCDAVMLDTAGGGTGRTFDWTALPVYRQWAEEAGLPLIVAGGLNPDNVGELVGRYRPDGVDVSSGVETAGQKDSQKIIAFVERVKQCDWQCT